MNGTFANTSVLFISMPFAPLLTPSLGLSLLKAKLAEDGIASEILYFGIDLAQRVGPSIYSKIASGAPANHDLAGEWIFSNAVFNQTESAEKNYIREILRGQHPAHNKTANNQREFPDEFFEELISIRGQITTFLDECLEQVIIRKPQFIGFTTVFQQNLASLALAIRIRERLAETFLVFGGANCEGLMGQELLRQFSFIDAIVSGPGEMVVTQLVKRALEGHSIAGIPGISFRRDVTSKGLVKNALQIPQMDDLPIPDFDDYFSQFKDAKMDLPIQPRLLFETSRGCWWGQKHHCTFCGLNGQSMNHRSKSAARALYELEELAQRYPGLQFSVVDNILDMIYFKDFLPSLAKRNAASLNTEKGLRLELFYEVKANLKKVQLRLLRDAGVTQIQPGIESFSDAVLQLMHKGVRAIQNIQLLKWCKELGILPSWNILWGFPGEPPTDYLQMAELVPLLSHLPPPSSVSPIRLDRFSPNFEAPEKHGFRNVKPYPSYYYIYPLSDEAVHNLAYFFIYERIDQIDPQAYTAPLIQRITEWQDHYDRTDFFSIEVGHWLMLWDFRPIANTPLISLSGLARLLYLTCDQACTLAQLQDIATMRCFNKADIAPLLEVMCERGLMLQDGGYYLSLAVPVGIYTPTINVLRRLEQALTMIGKRDNTAGVTSIDCRDHALMLA
jgi:ribosomal peptide maturation radical SAM protein 1